ncbi:MAG TPA: PAS domain-containing sensor histidine kinase [Cyclobacteriaceae bacterium]|nr:PAS domain-containing sensor histidine kinase [Cyclobacteriaceae bacterium]
MPLSSPLVLDTIFRNAESTSLLIVDRSGKIVDFNLGFQKLFGYSRETLVGKDIAILYAEDALNSKLPKKVIEKVISAGTYHEENFLKHQDGSLIWVHDESLLTKDSNGEEHLVKIIYNLSKEKLLEKKLTETNKTQEKILSEHDTFVYTTSHDLRSPINNLDALVQNVEESHNDPEAIQYLVPLLNDSIARLRSKINELSAIGQKMEKGNNTGFIDFQTIYDEVLPDLHAEIQASNAQLFSDFSQVPTIKFSKKDAKSLLHNLISNSLKYRSPNRKPIISVKSEQVGDEGILLTVKDNGIGIRLEDKERIFEMYRRFHTHVEGTGVGLGIVKKIVSNNGGKIEVESNIGEGSLFKIYLKTEETFHLDN